MSVFNLHSSVLSDYRDFVRSFLVIADERALQLVEACGKMGLVKAKLRSSGADLVRLQNTALLCLARRPGDLVQNRRGCWRLRCAE